MSDVAKGARRVGDVATSLAALGYRVARISASGQAKGSRRQENPIAGDLLALAPEHSGWPHLMVEVGGEGKRVARALQGLRGSGLPPGFCSLVVRFLGRRRAYYGDAQAMTTDLREALDGLRER
jgi:hypothetical protein